MEKERFFGNLNAANWQPSDQLPREMNCSGASEQLPPPCFLNLNWDNSMDASGGVQFESALSSLVSSPSSAGPAADSAVIRELIGRLGSICNSGEISPPAHYMNGNASANTSCYSTPLNSPPKLNLSMADHSQGRGGIPLPVSATAAPHLAPFSADQGFAERAAMFSCFGGRSYGGPPGQLKLLEAGKLSRVPSSQSLKANASQICVSENGRSPAMPEAAQFVSRASMEGEFKNSASREESSTSEPNAGLGDGNSRKRKVVAKAKGKEIPMSSSPKDLPKVEEEESKVKRSRSADGNGTEKDAEVKPKVEHNGSASSNGDGEQKQGNNNARPPEAPKQDYIHVRARRGQATDSHSLAERVRREKISERMKFLQDLVPGCNRVTGKAVMLDEIINYVQSLQRQVEFLSMKLATVNPRSDYNLENFLPKDMHQSRGPLPPPVYPMETVATAFSCAHQPQQGTPLQSIVTNGLETQCSVNHLDPNLCRTAGMQLPLSDGFEDVVSQLGNFWEDDLQSVVQMGFVQNQEAAFSFQSIHGSLPTAHTKIEL